MSLANQIGVLLEPTLELRQMAKVDMAGLSKNVDPLSEAPTMQVKDLAGKLIPMIEIGNFPVPPESIVSVELDQTDFLPTINITFIDTSGYYQGQAQPIDTPLIKLFITHSTVLKPYRADFLLTSSIATPQPISNFTGAREMIYTVTGELFIPGIYGTSIESIGEMTSFEALKEIAKKLKIGFASNIKNTNDKMTWINPNNKRINWIKDISRRAWSSDKAFYTSFIDINYHLNLVDVELAIGPLTPTYLMPADALIEPRKDASQLKRETSTDVKDYKNWTNIELSNSQKRIGAGAYAIHHMVSSNQGEILKNSNFKKSGVWHNPNYYEKTENFLKFYVEPISTKTGGSESPSQYLKPTLKNFDEESTTRWLGIDYGNGHPNHKFSPLINLHNVQELQKNYVKVQISGFANYIIRGGKVDLVIFKPSSENILNSLPKDESVQTVSTNFSKEAPEEYITYSYYVMDIKFRYDSMAYDNMLKNTTELTLARRDWRKINEGSKVLSEENATKNTQ